MTTVPDAMWFCANSETISEIPQGKAHPTSIRKWADAMWLTKSCSVSLTERLPEDISHPENIRQWAHRRNAVLAHRRARV